MKLLIDTNVILDFLLKRGSDSDLAKRIFDLAANESTYEFVSSSAATDLFYIVKRQTKESPYEVQEMLEELFSVLTILDVTKKNIDDALSLRWKDFEDAVQFTVARANEVDIIVSRNAADYESKEIPVMNPSELLRSISLLNQQTLNVESTPESEGTPV